MKTTKNEVVRELVEEALNNYDNYVSSFIEVPQGQRRNMNGMFTEGLIRTAIERISEVLEVEIECLQSVTEKKKLVKPSHNNVALDIHVLSKEGESLLAVESKTNLDKKYLMGIASEVTKIKMSNALKSKPYCLVFALFFDTSEETMSNTVLIDAIDGIYCMFDGSRNQKAPWWKPEHKRPLNEVRLTAFFDRLYDIISNGKGLGNVDINEIFNKSVKRLGG